MYPLVTGLWLQKFGLTVRFLRSVSAVTGFFEVLLYRHFCFKKIKYFFRIRKHPFFVVTADTRIQNIF